MFSWKALGIATVLGCGALSLSAKADTPNVDALKAQSGAALMAAIDKRTYDYSTQKWVFRMTITEKSGASREAKFSVWQKGSKRLVRFLEPGDVKGMSMLSGGNGEMYVYSPQTDNTRRIATSARRQTLLGSDMAYDDMQSVGLEPLYNVTVGQDTGSHVWLELAKKEGADVVWDKLRLRIDKKAALPDLIEYWDGGKKIRDQSRTGFTEEGGAPTWKSIKMLDIATGHSTTLDMLEQKIGEAIPDSVFSKRTLVRGQ